MKKHGKFETPQEEPEQSKGFGPGNTALNWLLGLLLTVTLAGVEAVLFLKALADNQAAAGLRSLLGSPLLLVLTGAVLGVVLLLVCLNNSHRFRCAFLTGGSSSLLAAALSLAGAFTMGRIAPLLPGRWGALFESALLAWREYALLAALVLTALGALWLCIYGSIRALRGGKDRG